MSSRFRATATVMSMVLLLGVSFGAAAETEVNIDGGPMDAVVAPRAEQPVSGDVVSALPEPAGAAPQSGPADLPERTDAPKAAPVPASVVLAGLDQREKLNATIELEPFGAADAAQQHQAARVEDLWTAGRFAKAIQDVENLEAAGARFAVGIAWKEPVPVDGRKVYPDVQVSSRTGGDTASLDYHADTGNIFVLVVWDVGWSMNISTDLGQSFSETYYWADYTAVADMSVSGDYAWVGYTSDGDAFASSRFRRFSAETGNHDGVYSFHVVADETPNTMTEIAVEGNTPDKNNRIYVAYLVDETNSIKFWWDDIVGTSFSEIPTGITDADSGLDLAWNPFYQASGHARWISYLSTGNLVRLYRSFESSWESEASHAYSGMLGRTALSAFNDHIYCAFECESDPGKVGVCYLASDDAGASVWLHDDAYWPTGSEVSGWAPDISIRSGLGRAAVFSSETGDLDDVYVVTKPGWDPGPWSDPAWYNTYDHVSGDETYIEWIGSSCVSTYGMVYFDQDGPNTPFFDLLTQRGFFCDGFEGGTGAWSASSP